MPSYPLLCLAAQYSQRVYTKPAGKERETHVDANWKMGTKAMVIKSVPVDDMNTIVFAIRGSQTFMDWAVNLNSAPVSPGEFLVSIISFNLVREPVRCFSDRAKNWNLTAVFTRWQDDKISVLKYFWKSSNRELNICQIAQPDRHVFQNPLVALKSVIPEQTSMMYNRNKVST